MFGTHHLSLFIAGGLLLNITAPAAPRQIHEEIRDSSIDALPDYRVLVSPDIVLAIVDVDATEVVFRLRHRPGSFDAAITRFIIDLDIDQNAATGSAGIEYSVLVFPQGGKGADVVRATGAGRDQLGLGTAQHHGADAVAGLAGAGFVPAVGGGVSFCIGDWDGVGCGG